MGFLGIEMGLIVACLWGFADIFATLAAHRLSTFRTTMISQLTSFLGLLLIGAATFWFSPLFLTLPELLHSMFLGVFTGFCASLAYLALYRCLKLGPVAITGPLTATSPVVTLLLSAFILRQNLTLMQLVLVLISICGVVLASTNLPELRSLLSGSKGSLWTQGVRWAIVATLAFGSLDFGIGASVTVSDWFLPGLCTRFFTLFFLLLFGSMLYLLRKFYMRKHFISTQQTVPLQLAAGPSMQQTVPLLSAITPSMQRTVPLLSVAGPKAKRSLKRPSSKSGLGIGFALLVGIIESAAILVFSLDTQLVTTGVTAAIASSYGLFVLLFGVLFYRERLALNQFLGIALFMFSIVLLTLS
ncbi:MAG TPA: DMT family transporter [Ktedonobacteraceae bacterium]